MRKFNFALFRLQDYRDQVDADKCYIALFGGKTKSLVLSCLRYAEFFNSRWYVDDENELGNFTDEEQDEIEGLVDQAQADIVMTCDAEAFIKTQRMLVAAITGETVDLDSDLPTGVVDFSGNGLSPKFEGDNGNLAQAVETLQVALEDVKTAIETADPADLEDDIANIWGILQVIATALGGTVGLPPVPL
jgi:hypothetical protein